MADNSGFYEDVAFRRTRRTKIAVLLGFIGIAAAGAGWHFLRPQGVGNPDEPSMVMIVKQELGGLSNVLTEWGFSAPSGTYQAWLDKFAQEFPESDAAGLDALVQLADTFGYGFIVFENPQSIDFS